MHQVTVGAGAPHYVMMHCMLARHEALLPLARAVGGRVTLADLPGHGRSDDWDGVSDYHTLARDIIAAACDGPVHLVGHSFSATAALRLAVEQPALVKRLTLIEPVYFAAAKGTAAHRAHAAAFQPFLTALENGDRAQAAAHFQGLWGAGPWQKLPEKARDYITDRIHLVQAAATAIEEDPLGITSAARLAKLDMPVTLIRGGRSQPVMADIHDTLAARIPQAQQVVVPDAGHMLPLMPKHLATVAGLIRAEVPETL